MTPATQRGVTLLELMIVVVIVGILSAIAFPNYRAYAIDSNRTAVVGDLHALSLFPGAGVQRPGTLRRFC